MPRRPRGNTGNYVYHVLNRAVRRATLFETPDDFAAFENVILQALQRVPIRLIASCEMSNHWHLVLWPDTADALPRFMHWLTCTHAQRWHAHRGTAGTGAVYQGRYKAVPVASDEHLLRVCRYVERNPLRAGMVTRAEYWRWSSLWRRCNSCVDGYLSESPVLLPATWVNDVNEPQSDAELAALRNAIRRGAPFGSAEWQATAAHLLGLESQLRPIGRPRKA
jgi:putative transposase